MNLFELQQRANILVQKVNEYEASLTGTTIDEEDTLNKHTYADLYCLRPVMKLLFGATLAEKLNRTLDNDLPLRVFASSAPAWNSTFNLLSYNPGKIIDNTVTYTSLNSSYSVPQVYTKQEITNYRYNASKPLATLDQAPAKLNYGYENLTFTTGSDVQTIGFILSQDTGLMLYQKQGRLEMNKYGGGNPTVIIQELQPNTTYYTKGYIYDKRFEYSTDKVNWTTVSLNSNYGASYSRRVYFGAEYSGINPFPGTIDVSELIALSNSTPDKRYSISLSERYLGILFGTVQIDNLFISTDYTGNWQNAIEARIQPERPLTTKNTGAGSQSAGDSYIYKTRYMVVNDNNLTGNSGDGLQLFRIRCHNDDYSTSSDIVEYVYGYQAKEFRFSGSNAQINLTLPRTLKIGDTLDVELRLFVWENPTGRYCMRPDYLLTLNKGKDDEWTGNSLAEGPYWSTNELKPTTVKFCSGAFDLCQDLSETYVETYIGSYDVGYQSNQHEFMNNIDMYNNYNMCQLDVTQNSVTNKDTRIPLGINYSYSANIADALVTECQVANIFNWNTTTSTQIANNTISINRQVPGIVCYYLGNGYNSTFTATIPYSPRLDNINSINYGTPPYYGAFYRNGNDIEISQVGLQMGAEACRIFMPGLNYTRGKLESPQQIWQPEKLVGDANIDKGFNWQGRAIYHELVFKNRRAGSSDAGVDFKPTLDNVADNDPQGLATRFALAQQKPFYNNRPWFKELDELYGADPTKLVNYINNNSVIVPKDEEVYQLETCCNLVGSPDYNELTGRLTNCSSANYCEVASPIKLDIQNADSLEPKTCRLAMDLYFTPGNYSSTVDLLKFAAQYNNDNAIRYNPSSGHWSFYGANSSNSFTGLMNPGQTYLINVEMYRLNSSRYRVICGLNELNEDLSYKSGIGSMISEYPLPQSVEASFTNKFFLNNPDTEYLLDKSRLLYRYNTTTDTILNFTKFIIKDNTVFDKSLFTLTGAVNLSDDGILSPITPTTGAVITNNNSKLDISTNKSFEVYSPRIYTSSNNGTPFKLEANNNGYIEAKVTFEADKVAASVNCQLLNFLVFDLSVYITQADINWVQFKFVNDVTSKTFKAYAMSDKTNDNWQLINEGAVTTDENPAVYIINNYKLGFMDSDTDNKKLDLTSIKLILEGETLFSSMSTPDAVPMNDTEFYNQYKLDYDTWANALNKPL